MSLPMVVMALLLVIGAGLLGVDVVTAQGLARDTARTAAVAGPVDAQRQAERAAGNREVEVELSPAQPRPGELVTASVRLRSLAFGAVGVDVWLPARASMPVEAP
jgi:hypothetical protein